MPFGTDYRSEPEASKKDQKDRALTLQALIETTNIVVLSYPTKPKISNLFGDSTANATQGAAANTQF